MDATRPIATLFGGVGYIGSMLAQHLVASGWAVRCVDNNLYGKRGAGVLATLPEINIIDEDYRNEAVVRAALRDADVVVHLGGFVGEPACEMRPDITVEMNLEAPIATAQAAAELGVRSFVFASSCSVYGVGLDVIDETSPTSALSLYAATKLEVEDHLDGLCGDGMQAASLRFATVYGVSPRQRLDSVVNRMAATAAITGRLHVRGGDQWRPLVHVRDAVRAIERAMAVNLDGTHQRINVGSDEQNHSIRELGEILARSLPRIEVVEETEAEDGRNYAVRFGLMEELLGLQAEHQLVTGAREVYDMVRAAGITDVDDREYNNLVGLRHLVDSGQLRALGAPA